MAALCESDHIFTALSRSVSQRYLTGRARKCGSAGCVLTMARLRHPVMKHRGDVIDLEVNSAQVSPGDNGQRALLLQVE